VATVKRTQYAIAWVLVFGVLIWLIGELRA
jgi:hypothetical protein